MQHIRDGKVQIGHPQFRPIVGFLRSRFQEVAVEYRPEHLHMARLLLREKVSRPPEIQISRTDGKTRSGSVEFLQNGQPLLGSLRVRIGQQIRKRAYPATSYSPPKLMELRKSEPFGPTDDDRIRPRDIETALHDVGRQQNVRCAFDELHHPL